MGATQGKPRKVRKALRQEIIINTLRGRIVAGDYPPASQLPARLALQDEFHASSITLQKALDTLAADGFLATRGHAGTFVTPAPPHLHTIGVLFGDQYLCRIAAPSGRSSPIIAWRSSRRANGSCTSISG